MTAGSEEVCIDVVRKVEIEEKCVAGLDINDLKEVGAVASSVGGNGNLNGDGKEDTDDSSYVFVTGSIEVSAVDPDDTLGVKSDSVYEIEQFKKEELGIENGEMSFDPLVLETNGVLHESATVTDAEVKVDKGDVNLENESTVDPSIVVDTDLIAKDVNGHLDKITVEEGEVVRSTEELQDVNGITNGEAKPGDVVPEFSVDSESTLNPIESSQVTAFELESTVKPSEESKSQVEQRVESEANLVKSDSAYEVGAADPDDTGGVKFDSAYEIEQFKKEELGIENREMSFDPLVLETNGVVANGNIKPSWGEESDNLEQNVDASRGEINRDKMSFPEVEDIDDTQSDEIPTSSVEGSVSDAIDTQNEETEVLAYNFLIRIPRFEDESFRDQIRSAQLLVEEKTSLRDAIRVDIQGKRARLRAHNETYNAAKLEETAARRLVRLKRQEIDSVQIVINRWKNAMSVEDIDARILNTEYMIQHETLDLKDEKQFIREIKQLKTLRDQLASNMGTEEEIRQAIDQKDHNEDRMKILRKELDSLKDKVSKAEAVVKAVGKKYDEESRKERELQAQFRVADDVRQKAYAHLNSVKKLSYDKNKNFRMYKEDAMAARDFVSRGDKDALHRLCANQVEAFMEQWNNNDEFRKEYVSRCSMNANRRQKAFEGSSLVPDDVASVVPSKVNSTVDRSLISIPVEVKTVSMGSAGEQGNIVSIPVEVKSIANLSAQKNQILKTKGPAKPTLGNDVPMVAELTVVTEAIDKKEEENTVTKEELEMAKRDEELKKAEIEAKLREQRRLEEKAKAIEALERKKRNAEKAQLKAELRARKEVEQKEKEREKRLRKKEKKKVGGGDSSINGEEAASSESSNEATTKETEPIKENNIRKKTQKPPAHFFSKQLKPKPIPPPLINRNKKRWQQYGKFALAVVAILALFFVGNTGFFTKLKGTKSAGPI